MLNLKRTFQYDENGDAMMVITKEKPQYVHIIQLGPKEQDRAFVIRHDDAWKFSSEHNEKFEAAMKQMCCILCEMFELGDYTMKKFADIASFIEDGLELLLEVKPQETHYKTIGEVTVGTNPVGEDVTETFTNDIVVDEPVPYKESYSE
ncbi:MAG: hypothetical protein GY861_28295 [bacterium]|nr:hypothetical protein [bacterium]